MWPNHCHRSRCWHPSPGWHGSSPGAQIFGTGAFCGPSIEEIDEKSCAASIASIEAAEEEFIKIGRLAAGLEESFFLIERSSPWRNRLGIVSAHIKDFLSSNSAQTLQTYLQDMMGGIFSLINNPSEKKSFLFWKTIPHGQTLPTKPSRSEMQLSIVRWKTTIPLLVDRIETLTTVSLKKPEKSKKHVYPAHILPKIFPSYHLPHGGICKCFPV